DDKGLIDYEKSKGVTLTKTGRDVAVRVLRKHRIWETFLVKNLEFGWEEVDEIAEQLEHINSDKLIERIDKLLGYPRFDPHGDPIPDSKGKFRKPCFKCLSEMGENDCCRITGVKEDSEAFVKYFNNLGLSIGDRLEVKEIEKYDQSLVVKINRKKQIHIGNDVAKNILITLNAKCCVFGEGEKNCPLAN
ncbi:MAG: metal-dependent transcriptional regulator, partial [Bacteroidota bacterium]